LKMNKINQQRLTRCLLSPLPTTGGWGHFLTLLHLSK
jgi:hypothetical protein